jgi:hypothetical protein
MQNNIIIAILLSIVVLLAYLINITPTLGDISLLLDSKFEIEPYVESN